MSARPLSRGVLAEDLSTSVPLPRYVNTLARRILAEDQVRKMIDLETGDRNQAILALLYTCGLRVSELCALRRRDLQSRGPTGQLTVTGKGRRVRVVLLPEAAWEQLQKLSDGMDPNSPVFRSRSGAALDRWRVLQIVREAARRAGLPERVSPHWLRHANRVAKTTTGQRYGS